MSASDTVKAALHWAERMERGEVDYNPYITALAKEIMRLQEVNAALASAAGITRLDETLDLVTALQQARETARALAQALRPFAENWDLHAAKWLGLGEKPNVEWFRLLEERIGNDIIAAMRNARLTLAANGDRLDV